MRGVFLVRATFGYDVTVDGHPLGMDASWMEADELATLIAKRRPPGDGRGYGRCRHVGNSGCFAAKRCVRTPTTTISPRN